MHTCVDVCLRARVACVSYFSVAFRSLLCFVLFVLPWFVFRSFFSPCGFDRCRSASHQEGKRNGCSLCSLPSLLVAVSARASLLNRLQRYTRTRLCSCVMPPGGYLLSVYNDTNIFFYAGCSPEGACFATFSLRCLYHTTTIAMTMTITITISASVGSVCGGGAACLLSSSAGCVLPQLFAIPAHTTRQYLLFSDSFRQTARRSLAPLA